jgi:hypothetical protein
MSMLRSAGVAVFGLLSLVAGCAATDSDDLDEEVGVAASADLSDKNNGTGNGLDSPIYHDFVPELLVAMDGPLVENGHLSTNLQSTQMTETVKGRLVLKYAFQCAASVGSTLPGILDPEFVGQELVSTATGWRDGPGGLPALARMDVLACVIARVNSTVDVPVLLSGANVNDDPGDDTSAFDVSEAAWLVKPGSMGLPEYHVWNLIPNNVCSQPDAWESLKERICAQKPELACGFVKRTDLGTACSLQPDGIWCDGLPTIATQLRRGDVRTLHPDCESPPNSKL